MPFTSCGVLGAVDDWVTLTVPVPQGSAIALEWNVSAADFEHLKHAALVRLVRGTSPTAILYQAKARRVYPERLKTFISLETLPDESAGEATYIQLKRWYYYRSFTHISEPTHSIGAFYFSP
ncbi:MAG: hypothetical protein WBA57_08750 [Elainellaceae cyanobacterium]